MPSSTDTHSHPELRSAETHHNPNPSWETAANSRVHPKPVAQVQANSAACPSSPLYKNLRAAAENFPATRLPVPMELQSKQQPSAAPPNPVESCTSHPLPHLVPKRLSYHHSPAPHLHYKHTPKKGPAISLVPSRTSQKLASYLSCRQPRKHAAAKSGMSKARPKDIKEP